MTSSTPIPLPRRRRFGLALALGAALAAPARGAAQASISDIVAWISPIDRIAHIRWTTRPAARCTVQFGSSTRYDRAAPEDPSSLRGTTNNRKAPGIGYANNHRADFPWPSDAALHFRIIARCEDGRTVRSRDFTPRRRPLPPDPPGARRVALRIDPGRWRVKEPPVVLGVPFPPGVVFRADRIRIAADGKAIPSQVEVVSRYWRDGSIKWARAAFFAPRGARRVELEYGGDVRRKAWPAWRATAEQGSWKAVLAGVEAAWSAERGGWFRAGRRRIPLPQPVLADADGKPYPAKTERVEIEEAGPVRAVIRMRGHHVAADGSRHFAFVLRAYVFAGRPYARIDYTFENDLTGREMTSIRSIELVFPHAGRARVRTDAGQRALAPGGRVFQREDFEWTDETGAKRGKRLPGVVELPDLGARVLVKHFWEQYPKAFEARGDALVVALLPKLPAGFYAHRPNEDKLYFYLRDGHYTFRQGFSKTHELWLDLSGRPEALSLIEDGPTACADPLWIEKTGALRKLGVAVRDQFPHYDEYFVKMAEGILRRREAAREYGMMNFGDWYGERIWNWGNLEYDLGHGLFTQFARTGDARFFWRGQEAVRHEGDVDTRRYAKDPRRVGQQWTHCMGHTANYYPKTYKHMHVYASPGWSDNRGHVWAQGLLEHYLLGGDRRSWRAGLLIADWAAGPQTTHFRFGNAREPGWMLRLVMSAYYATDDPYYLNAARLMIRKVREMSEATGGRGFYYHRLSGGHCRCTDTHHYGEAGFMLGVLMSGMKMYYDVTGDERVADDIVGIAKFIVQTMWVPERCEFHYTSCPRSTISHGSAFIMMEGLAFAAARSRDERLCRVCREALAASWSGLGSGGKTSGYRICSIAQAISEFAKLPGPKFADALARFAWEMHNPARRALPTLLDNPDFEEYAYGWPPRRGAAVELCSGIKHSGRRALKVSGRLMRQNEYINTCYDTANDPGEIRGLVPGRTYRLTVWLRVDKLSPGAPAPSARLAFRDAAGTRGNVSTNAYDLKRMGTWQKLTLDAKIPAYNTRNYIALNTNTRKPVEAVLYVDDVSLVPLKWARKDTYVYARLDPDAAERSPGLRVDPGMGRLRPPSLTGAGTAKWSWTAPHADAYDVWARVRGAGALGRVLIDGRPLGALKGRGDSWRWALVGSPRLTAGPHRVVVEVARGLVGRLVLTDDYSARETAAAR